MLRIPPCTSAWRCTAERIRGNPAPVARSCFLLVSEVVAPAEGDTIEADGTVYVIQGEPIRDAERLVWTVDARPA